MNLKISLTAEEIIRLVNVLKKFVISRGKNALKNALELNDMDISELPFPEDPTKYAEVVVQTFKEYSVTKEHPGYHPLAKVLKYLLEVRRWEDSDRQFLESLIARGEALIKSTAQKEDSSSSHTSNWNQQYTSSTSTYQMPKRRQRFLKQVERDRIVNIVSTLMSKKPAKDLLIESGIRESVIEGINYKQGNRDVASDIVKALEKEDALESPEYHALGAFLNTLIDVSADYDTGTELTEIIFSCDLIKDKDRIQKLSSDFQVPSPIFIERPSASPQFPEWSYPPNPEERLESLYTDEIAHYVEAEFLHKGNRLIHSICRVEFGGTAEGTGFLVGSDLILTSYHVLMPTGSTKTIEERARQCAVRFGAIRNSKNVPLLIELADECWCRASSKSDDLDYALLRLKRSTSGEEGVTPISLAQHGQIREADYVNIIHHPQGGYMAVSLRYNQVVAIREERIFYLADTENRSSGAPVFNDNWQIVALHRSGGEKDAKGNLLFRANAGILIKFIFQQIEPYLK